MLMSVDLLQQAAPSSPNALMQFAPIVFIFVIFYFLLIAPMRKKQKATQEMLAKLKRGDEVITTGGIFGRITAVDEERGTVVLQISDNTKVKMLRTGIAGAAGEPEAAAAVAKT